MAFMVHLHRHTKEFGCSTVWVLFPVWKSPSPSFNNYIFIVYFNSFTCGLFCWEFQITDQIWFSVGYLRELCQAVAQSRLDSSFGSHFFGDLIEKFGIKFLTWTQDTSQMQLKFLLAFKYFCNAQSTKKKKINLRLSVMLRVKLQPFSTTQL